MELPKEIIKNKLLSFLQEDLGYGDITSNLLISDNLKIRAAIVSDEAGIIAGINEIEILCEIMNVKINSIFKDGNKISADSTLIEIEGNAKSILAIERTLLNILMRMSGIATTTKKIIDDIEKINPKLKIACTRKTTPGFRYFEKKAVSIAGGDTHRYRLDDMILIKDNHLYFIDDLSDAIIKLKKKLSFSKKIELEVKSKKRALEAAKLPIDILMLDNFTPEEAKQTIDELKKQNLRDKILIEISGGINPENIKDYALLDLDIISMGFLTHSIDALGMSLDIVEISEN